MTQPATPNKIQYIADGLEDTYVYPFRVIEAEHMQVFLDGVLQASGYTVTDVGSVTGGDVVFDTVVPATTRITLRREVPIEQEYDYRPYDPFPAESHETALDLGTQVDQQLAEALGRTPSFPPDSPIIETEIEEPSQGSFIEWDEYEPFKWRLRNVGLGSADYWHDGKTQLGGAHQVTGTWVFQTQPFVPDPNVDGQAANKGYVDGVAAGIEGRIWSDDRAILGGDHLAVGNWRFTGQFRIADWTPGEPDEGLQVLNKQSIDIYVPDYLDSVGYWKDDKQELNGAHTTTGPWVFFEDLVGQKNVTAGINQRFQIADSIGQLARVARLEPGALIYIGDPRYPVTFEGLVVNFVNQPTVFGNDIWHEGNMGPGSGLDADTVHGLTPGELRPDLTTGDVETLRITDTGTEVDVTTLTNQGNGLVKLSAIGKIPLDLLPVTGLTVLGPYRGDDDCPKPGDDPPSVCTEPDTRNPSQRFPDFDYNSGALFIISTTGTMSLQDAIGADNVVIKDVEAGDGIIYVPDLFDPDPPNEQIIWEGWYLIPGLARGINLATNILFDDTNTTIKGANVQVWNEAADAVIDGKTNRAGGESVTGSWTFSSSVTAGGFIRSGGFGASGVLDLHNTDSTFRSRLVQNAAASAISMQGWDGAAWVGTLYFEAAVGRIRPIAAAGGGVLNELGSTGAPWNRIHVGAEVLIDQNPAWHQGLVTLAGAHTATGAWTFNANVTIGSAGILTIDRTGDNVTPLIVSSGAASIAQFRSTGANNNLQFTFDGGLERYLGYTSGGLLRTGSTGDLNGAGTNIWHDGLAGLGGNHSVSGNWTVTGLTSWARNIAGDYLTTIPTRSLNAAYDVGGFSNTNNASANTAALLHFSATGNGGVADGRYGLVNLGSGSGAFVWQGRNGSASETVELMRLAMAGTSGNLLLGTAANTGCKLNIQGGAAWSWLEGGPVGYNTAGAGKITGGTTEPPATGVVGSIYLEYE